MQVKLHNYDPESQNKWFQRLPIAEQMKFNSFLEELANPHYQIPEEYKGSWKRMNQEFKLNADPGLLTDEQIYAMDQQLVRTYYSANVGAQIMAPVTTYMPNPRWVSQHYTITGDTFPEFSKGSATAFRTIKSLKLGVEPTLNQGVGGAIKWELPFTLLKEGADGAYSPDFWHSYKAGEVFGKFWNQRILLGTAGENTSGDIGITGLHNFSGLTTQAGGAGADNNMAAAGDVDATLRLVLGNLLTVYEPGDNVFISTSGVATELFAHDSTYTDSTEVERVRKKFFNTGLVSRWYVDNDMEADTNATSTGRFMMVRMSPSTVNREIIYPFQKKPLNTKEFEDDLAYALIMADLIKYYNASAGVICAADQTTTSAGIVHNGLFMTGSSRNDVNPSPTNILV